MSKQRVKCTHQTSSQGTSVLKVEAVDADKGVNDNVTYSITSEKQGVPRRAGVRVGWSEPLEELLQVPPYQTPQGPDGSASRKMASSRSAAPWTESSC